MADHSGAFAPAPVTSPLSTEHPNRVPTGALAPTAIDPERVSLAQALADKAAKHLWQVVLEEMMSPCAEPRRRHRWLCELTYHPFHNDPHQACVVSLVNEIISTADNLPRVIPKCNFGDAQLYALAEAVDHLLTQRKPGASGQATAARQRPA